MSNPDISTPENASGAKIYGSDAAMMETPAITTPPAERLLLVTGAFATPDDAEKAIGALSDHGVRANQISVATLGSSDTEVTSQSAHATTSFVDKDGFMEVQTEDPPTPTDMNAATDDRRGQSSTSGFIDSPIAAQGERGITTTTEADAAAGAGRGAAFGLGLGLIAGAAALTIPGVGLVLAAGPLWAALAGLAGATAAGATAGGVTGYLKDMGVHDTAADRHHEALRAGATLVTVHMDENDDETVLAGLLRKYGGVVE